MMLNLNDTAYRVRERRVKTSTGFQYEVYGQRVIIHGICNSEDGQIVYLLDPSRDICVDSYYDSESFFGSEDWEEARNLYDYDSINDAIVKEWNIKQNSTRKTNTVAVLFQKSLLENGVDL